MTLDGKRILVVGAGGIGCELLKNLAICGCTQIFVIDLDTIEYSNLNRQFLFQREHVGRPKAEVAANAISKFAPDLKIEWRHKSIMEPEFDVNFFKTFDYVLNALDNRAARNHVNRVCLAADTYLIESGSNGYLGQTTVIKKGVTECYECQAKAPPKNYPACTIRNTPSESIHCIIWAKHLFNQLFGQVDPDEDVSPDMNDAEASEKENHDQAASTDNGENGTQSNVRNSKVPNGNLSNNAKISTRKWAIDHDYDAQLLFNKLYSDDITYLLSMTNLWKKRTPPTPLILSEVECFENAESSASANEHGLEDHKVWPLVKCSEVFVESVQRLKQRLNGAGDGNTLSWDKDDDVALDFVTSCANLRCAIFHIGRKSRFEIKSMAGNIVPAIATTNVIVAGLIVKELMNLCSKRLEDCATTYLIRKPNYKGNYFTKCALFPPNPKCYVCSDKAEVQVKLNIDEFTVKALEEKILKQNLNMVAPDVEIEDNKGTIIISSEKDEISGLDDKTLAELNIRDGTRLHCDDFNQQFELRLLVVNCPDSFNDDAFEVISDVKALKPQSAAQPMTSKRALEESNSDDEICCFDDLKKRKIEAQFSGHDDASPKRLKTA